MGTRLPSPSRGSRRQAGSLPADAGVTLLELIMVLFILSMVIGAGLGMFAALDTGRNQAAGVVKNVLRSAQNTAIASQAPARVRIDKETGTLTAEALHVVGTWHFEGRSVTGAFGLDGQADPELFIDDGYIGSALSFVDQLGSYGNIPVEHDPAFDFTHGFAVECAVRKEGVKSGTLLSIGSIIFIDVSSSGEVRGRFTPEIQKQGLPRPGGPVIVQSGPGALTSERWTRVRLQYDRRELVLLIDGAPVAKTLEEAPVWELDGQITLSDPRRPFPGSLDNLVVSAVEADDSAVLAETVTIAEAPLAVNFGAGGGLDRRLHPEPVRIVVRFEDGSDETIGVGYYGTVE